MTRRLLRVVIATCLCVSFRAAHGFTASYALHRQPIQQIIPRYDNKHSRNRGIFHRLAQKDDDEEATNQFDWNVIGRQFGLFQDMAFPYYEESTRGRWLLAGLLALTLLNSGVSVLFSYLGKDFWNALSAKDIPVFYEVLQKYLGALIVGAPVITLYRYQRQRLAIHWREWMTARTFELYTSNRVYYNLDPSIIDNPDQRITEDVKSFTSYSLQLVITIITSLIDLVSFSLILWGIYPQLFVAIIAYATFGTVVTTFLGRPLVHLNFKQLQREADLRYSLVRLRDNAESIAFYGGEDLEGQAVEDRLERVTGNRRALIEVERNLEFFTTAYRYLIQIVPVAVVAPKYFAGDIGLGVISQSVGAFNHILSDLSIIINQFEQLSTFSAGIDRLASFYDAMRASNPERASTNSGLLKVGNRTALSVMLTHDDRNATVPFNYGDSSDFMSTFGTIALKAWNDVQYSGKSSTPTNRPVLQAVNLDLCTPDQKRMLIRNLTFELQEGQNLLIVGNSGAGKSSLLRAIAGLWTKGNGSIYSPPDDSVYFLPQRPYCTLGSLKDQLLYPSVDLNATNGSTFENKIVPKSHLLVESLEDTDLLDILEQVNLLEVARNAGDGDPVRGLYAVLDWSNRLSLGEQQRLAFGRVLVNRPTLVILDEATSALDVVSEARMYNLLQNLARRELSHQSGLSRPGLTYVSVGHRPSLIAFHDKKLRVGIGEGDSCEFSDIAKMPSEFPSSFPNPNL
ncbi:hypothetical protein FisN_20Lh275 [Fistulifera solaris]|uniref:ATP-binding cassette transporter n=1 Tax=Fistulifera solaris TaxID=1519565 RepID=A0A1Z5KRK2_FISSO|nr:hypothetical protein FisN_20Lh275 [Fistulifera solaris]|eukprot:GAX28950.1 hypothetical protein FisN_20Lh275 [Fistulifera solaris]